MVRARTALQSGVCPAEQPASGRRANRDPCSDMSSLCAGSIPSSGVDRGNRWFHAGDARRPLTADSLARLRTQRWLHTASDCRSWNGAAGKPLMGSLLLLDISALLTLRDDELGAERVEQAFEWKFFTASGKTKASAPVDWPMNSSRLCHCIGLSPQNPCSSKPAGSGLPFPVGSRRLDRSSCSGELSARHP